MDTPNEDVEVSVAKYKHRKKSHPNVTSIVGQKRGFWLLDSNNRTKSMISQLALYHQGAAVQECNAVRLQSMGTAQSLARMLWSSSSPLSVSGAEPISWHVAVKRPDARFTLASHGRVTRARAWSPQRQQASPRKTHPTDGDETTPASQSRSRARVCLTTAPAACVCTIAGGGACSSSGHEQARSRKARQASLLARSTHRSGKTANLAETLGFEPGMGVAARRRQSSSTILLLTAPSLAQPPPQPQPQSETSSPRPSRVCGVVTPSLQHAPARPPAGALTGVPTAGEGSFGRIATLRLSHQRPEPNPAPASRLRESSPIWSCASAQYLHRPRRRVGGGDISIQRTHRLLGDLRQTPRAHQFRS